MKISDTQGDGQTLECSVMPLGDINAEPKVKPSPCYYAITCSADPKMKCGTRFFHELSPREQKKIYYQLLKNVFYRHKDRYGFKHMLIHYELDKSLKIHTHGYVEVNDNLIGYPVNQLEIQSMIHKVIGRKGNYKNVCCVIKEITKEEDFNKWKAYCIKQNDLKPSKIIRHNILDYTE